MSAALPSPVPMLLAALLGAAIPQVAQSGADELSHLIERILLERREDLDPVVNRLVFLDSVEAAERVAALVGHPLPDVRKKAVWVLGFLEREESAEALMAALMDRDWEVRRDAAFALGRMKHAAAAEPMADLLHDRVREVRLEAARVLPALAGASGAPLLRRALRRTESDPAMEVALLRGLAELGDAASAPLATARLSRDDADVRRAANVTLLRLGDEEARGRVLSMAREGDEDARVEAARLMGEGAAEWAVEPLEEMLAEARGNHTALAAAESLARVGRESGLRYLAEVSSIGDPEFSRPAAVALERLGVRSDELAELRRRVAAERLAAADLPPEMLAADLAALGLPFLDRLLALSHSFRDVAYELSPLGEGAGVAPGPLYRWDAVDCLTFIEQVLALANLRQPGDLLPILIDIRYQRGLVAFGERNHLMEHQWLPNNIAKGWVRDITREVGGDAVVVARKEITGESWANRRGVDLPLSAEEVPHSVSELPIIPIGKIMGLAGSIPDGAILVVVRSDLPSRPIRVTHLGMIVRADGRTYLRHAARATYQRVIDEDLATFVLRNMGYNSWPVAGFNILLPRDNTRRAQALAAG